MPAVSPEQKHLACMALAYKKHGESVLKGMKDTAQVKEMAKMSEEQLTDYCGSKVKGK